MAMDSNEMASHAAMMAQMLMGMGKLEAKVDMLMKCMAEAETGEKEESDTESEGEDSGESELYVGGLSAAPDAYMPMDFGTMGA